MAKTASAGHSGFVTVLAAMVLGVAVGLAIGFIVTLTRAPAFMVTLGALTILAGAAAAWSHNHPIIINCGFEALGVRRFWGLPVSAYVFCAVALVAYLLLHQLKVGRLIFSVGDNEEAARLVGVRTNLIRLAVYALNGSLVGLGAAILTGRVGFGDPGMGVGLELQVIAAVVIGGATLAGGRGSLLGTALGVALLAAIANVLNLIGVASYVSDMVFGGFIVLAVGLRGPQTIRAAQRLSARLRPAKTR